MGPRRRRQLGAAAVGLAVAVGAAAPARADDDDERTLLHASLILAGGVAYATSETVLKDDLAPDRCRWCDDNALDRGVRDAVVWRRTGLAARTSDVLGFAITPALELSLVVVAGRRDGPARAWLADSLAVVESAIAAGLANQTTKFLVGRARPYAWADPGSPAAADPDANLSFYSGHTTLGFSLAASAGTVAQLRGYRWAPWIWGAGVALAATTGYLRMAADRHWLTDVVTGAVIGTGIGIAVPRLAHPHLGPRGGVGVEVVIGPGQVGVAGVF